MDQTMRLPTTPLFGGPDITGGDIDEPDMAQPSIGRDEPEAGDGGGSLDIDRGFPSQGGEDAPDDSGADNEGTA
jgi:hypothetical protein